MKTLRRITACLADRSGGTIIEYCLIAGLISIFLVGGATIMGNSANSTFTKVNTQVWGS